MSKRKRPSNEPISSYSDDENQRDNSEIPEVNGGFYIGNIYIPPPPIPVCSNDIGSKRLVIHNIVCKNFKSYANTIQLGPFHKCFSSIIGPNGSGKSNVIDSMLFVFGYRASRIRSKQISSLIHSSQNCKNIDSCSVSVNFTFIIDKSRHEFEEVPNSRFVVTRTAFKDNSSYYEIDNKRVTFKEVTTLLRQYGIDLDHNRFLILQGEVEQISMMKPKAQNEHETGMLEYLEDIIGTSRLKEPLLQLDKAVEDLTEERVDKIQRAKIIQKELDDISGPYEEAIGFLESENQLTKLKNVFIQKYIYDSQQTLQEKKEKKGEITEKINQLNENLETTIHTRKEKEKTLNEQQKEKDNLEKRLTSLKDTFDKIEAKDNSLMAEMEHINKQRKKNMSQLADEQKKLNDLLKIPEKNTADINQIQTRLEKLTDERETLEQKKQEALEVMANETKPLQEEREKLETKLAPFTRNTLEAKTKLKTAESELAMFMKRETEAIDNLQKIKNTHNNVEANLEEKKRLVNELKQNIPKTEVELRKSSDELNRVQVEIVHNSEKLTTLRGRVEESRAAVQCAKFRGKVLNSLMQMKQSGKIPGILGRLGDLGAIDAKYDVAISTACGPLDHVLVEDVPTAEACINYLQKNNIGKVNCIALDKQEHLRQYTSQKIQTPENVPRLFDLIRCDERIKTAFYFGLRNTLVAENLAQATRIAYGSKRYRVVTLGGDLIELTGTMSGGGNTVSRGRMGQEILVNTAQSPKNTDHNTPDRINKMLQQVETLSADIQRLRELENRLNVQVTELTDQLNRMKMNYQSYVDEVQLLNDQLSNTKKEITRQEQIVKQSKSDEKRVANFKKNIDVERKAYEKAEAAASEIQEQISKLTNEIKSKAGGPLKKIQNELKEKNSLIDKLKAENTKLQVGITTSKRNVTKCQDRIVNLEQDIKTAQNRLLEIKEERNVIENDAKQIQTSIDTVESQLESQTQNNKNDNELKKEIAALHKEENKIKMEQVDIRHQLSTIESTVKEFVANISHWREKLSKLSLHEIPSNEVQSYRDQVSGISDQNNDANRSVLKKETLRVYTDDDLRGMDLDSLQSDITVQEDKLKGKKLNLNVINEFKKLQDQYILRSRAVDEVTERRNLMRETYEKLKTQRNDEFLKGYQIINLKLKEMYQMITLGGDAELELVDSLDPFSEGVSFSVRPPKKSWKLISFLSGGEKTLSSLALVFALHYYKPSPLYVMDEIDAALDFKNVSIVGNYIKERTNNAQFIIISLRSFMFELADTLIGIFKTNNCTQSLTINPELYEKSTEPTQQSATQQLITQPLTQQPVVSE